MSENSPVDEAVVRLLERARQAVEAETTNRARQLHEAARSQGIELAIGGLLARQCTSLTNACRARERFYVDEASWLQRRRLRLSGQMGRSVMNESDGSERVLTSAEKRLAQYAEKQMRRKRQNFAVNGLLPTSIELTDAGPIQQDWQVYAKGRTLSTYIRTASHERGELVEATPVHTIRNFGDYAIVTEYEQPIEEADYFLPLGIIIEADKQVRSSVPSKISRHW